MSIWKTEFFYIGRVVILLFGSLGTFMVELLTTECFMRWSLRRLPVTVSLCILTLLIRFLEAILFLISLWVSRLTNDFLELWLCKEDSSMWSTTELVGYFVEFTWGQTLDYIATDRLFPDEEISLTLHNENHLICRLYCLHWSWVIGVNLLTSFLWFTVFVKSYNLMFLSLKWGCLCRLLNLAYL